MRQNLRRPLVTPILRGVHHLALCTIADACREIREHENVDTNHIRQDPAIRLMVYQLGSSLPASENLHKSGHLQPEAAISDTAPISALPLVAQSVEGYRRP
jgi:hypothetical protein